MPEPNDQKIEELLKRYAAKRRQGAAPTELHPVNRRLLQKEVSRTYGTKMDAANPARSWWASIRFWLPFAATVSVFVAVVGLILTREGTQTLKKVSSDTSTVREALKPATSTVTAPEAKSVMESLEPKVVQAVPQTSIAPAVAPLAASEPRPDGVASVGLNKAREERAGGTDKDTPKLSLTRPASETVERNFQLRQRDAAEKPAMQLSLEDQTARRGLSVGGGAARGGAAGAAPEKESTQLSKQTEVLSRGAAPAITLSGKTQADTAALKAVPGQTPAASNLPKAAGEVAAKLALDSYSASIRQRFQRTADVYRTNPNSPRPPNILNSFEFVQAGNQVEVIEPDGSSYQGQIVQAPTLPESSVAKGAAPATPSLGGARYGLQAPASKAPISEALTTNQTAVYFRVAGTNKTLKRLVVFDGNVAPISEAPSANAAFKQSEQNASRLNLNESSGLLNSRIQGQATYGSKQSMEINAIAAPPTK